MRKDYLGKPKYRTSENLAYEAFVRSKPCVICNRTPVDGHHVDHARRNCILLVPLCQEHHRPGFPDAYHQLEREKFETRHNINLDWICLNLLAEFIDEGR